MNYEEFLKKDKINDLKVKEKCPDCGGEVRYYNTSIKPDIDILTRVVCTKHCKGWKVIREVERRIKMQTVQVGNKIFNLERKVIADREKLEYKILQTILLITKGTILVKDSENLQKELEKYDEEGVLVLSTVDALLICSIESSEKLIERLR